MSLLIAYFLSNIFAKNYQNRIMYVKVIPRQNSDIFQTQCISEMSLMIWLLVVNFRI